MHRHRASITEIIQASRLPTPTMPRSLLQFLKDARQLHLHFLSGALAPANSPIYVVGNPSADLDSILSAIVYSYFAHFRSPSASPRSHIPLLNLPNIPSGPELYRLRPEFAKALWLCTGHPSAADENWEDTPESAGELLRDHIITVSDFATHLKEYGKDSKRQKWSADATLVDWNAMPIRIRRGEGCLAGLENVTFSVVGFIDHHVDEGFVPLPKTIQPNHPAIIQPAGSCASLVVSWLRSQGLWRDPFDKDPDQTNAAIEAQLAGLALSPILVDTGNLTVESKVTATDRDAVTFLTPLIGQCAAPRAQPAPAELYSQIHETKQNSLDLLTVAEVLDRDFKLWTETSRTGDELQIGFCSVVKSVPWVVRKAGNSQSFLDSLTSFSTNRRLDIVVVMTAYSSGRQFCRELLVCALRGGVAVDVLESFVSRASGELGLQDWVAPGERPDEQEIQSTLSSDTGKWRRLWVQGDVSKSRKQVAPLLRSQVARL